MGLIRRNGKWIEDGTPSSYYKDKTPKQHPKLKTMVKRGGRPKGSKNKPKPYTNKPFNPFKQIKVIDKPSLVTELEREALRAFRGKSSPYELPKHIPKHDNVRKELTPLQRDEARERARDAERLHLGLCKWNEWEY